MVNPDFPAVVIWWNGDIHIQIGKRIRPITAKPSCIGGCPQCSDKGLFNRADFCGFGRNKDTCPITARGSDQQHKNQLKQNPHETPRLLAGRYPRSGAEARAHTGSHR